MPVGCGSPLEHGSLERLKVGMPVSIRAVYRVSKTSVKVNSQAYDADPERYCLQYIRDRFTMPFVRFVFLT